MFNLTLQERQVILFLIAVALVGIGANFFAKKATSIKTHISFDENIGKADLNKADKQILVGIPGIGEKLAQRIIEYRLSHGSFKNTEELKEVKGITNYRYERIKDYLFVP